MYSRARVGRIDPSRVRARVPIVDRRVVLDAGIGAAPGGLGDLAHQLLGVVGVHRLAGDPGFGLPLLAALHGVHEVVGDANGVVRVLVLDRVEALAVDRHVEAGRLERSRLVLLLRLAPDEVADVGVVDVEHDHLCRAPGLSAALDRPRPRVGAAHERHRPRCEAALRELLLRGADLREVDARSGTAAEDHSLLGVPVEDRLHRVVDGEDEARRACGFSSNPTLNQTGELNAACWFTRMWVSSASNASASSAEAK